MTSHSTLGPVRHYTPGLHALSGHGQGPWWVGRLGCLAGVQAEQGKVEETRQRWAQLAGGGGTNSRDTDGAQTADAGPGKTQRHLFRPEILISNSSAFMDKAKGGQLLQLFFQKHPG